MSGVDQFVRQLLMIHLSAIEDATERDCLTIYGPFFRGIDQLVRRAIEAIPERNEDGRLAVVVDSMGGEAESVERIVETTRHFYNDVAIIVPDQAMSAGTIFAMSGDRIYMDYFSRLGPIDPQIIKNDKLIPARSYLVQFKRLIEKDRNGKLTTAEFVLLEKLDLAELHRFEQAEQLSITLLTEWLTRYKFKDWATTETRQVTVTDEMRQQRAKEIAQALSDNERWHSHGRWISRDTLEREVGLKIDRLEDDPELAKAVGAYHQLLTDFLRRENLLAFVQSRGYL